MIITVITFVLVVGLLIFVHEAGHFLSAKRAGIRVDEFGFGFPPRIFSITKGDTRYSLNWIPLGGFVRIKGESGDHTDDPDSFAAKPPRTRALIVAAGVVMNLVLAWVLLSFGYMIGLPQVAEGLSGMAQVRDQRLQVLQTLPGSPADAAGIQAGDTVVTVDGIAFASVAEFREYTGARLGVPMAITLDRSLSSGSPADGEPMRTEVHAAPEEIEGLSQPGLGIALVSTGIVSYPIWWAPFEGLRATYGFTAQILSAFGGLVGDLFSAQKTDIEFSGPLGIAVITGEVAARGFRHLLQFTALLSINLAVINILPIPALDGGRLFFLGMEWARAGRAVNRKVETMTHTIGFSLLLLLIAVITYKDIVRYGDGIWKSMLAAIGV